MISSPIFPPIALVKFATALSLMILAGLPQSGATAGAGSCSSCSGSDRAEIGFRASAEVRVVTGQPTAYGSVSIALAGRPMSATATSEGEVTTGTGMVVAPQETVLDGSMTVYLPMTACDCATKFSADFMPTGGCGQTVEIRLKQPDATSYGPWSNNLHPSWSMFYTTVETLVVQFQLRILSSDPGHAIAPPAVTEMTPPTVDWVPTESGGQLQEVPAAFASRIPMGLTTGTGKFNAGSLVLAGPLGTTLASRSNVILRSPIDTTPVNAEHPEPLHAVNDAGNVLRQVRSDTRLLDLIDVVEDSAVVGFSVRVFEAGDYGSFGTELYSINEDAVPSVTYTYRKLVDGESYLGISVETSHRDGTTETQTYLNTSSSEYTISSGDGLETVTVAAAIAYDVTDGWTRTELETVARDGMLYSKTLREFEFQTVTHSGGTGTTVIPFMTSEFRYLTVDGAGTGLTTTRTPSDLPGLPEVIHRPDGSWEKRVYYDGTGDDGGDASWLRLTKQIITPWNDSPTGPPEDDSANCQVETFTYAEIDGTLQAVAGTTAIPASIRVRLTESLSSTTTSLTGLMSAAGLSADWLPPEADLVGLRVAEEVDSEQIATTNIRYRSQPAYGLSTPPLVPWAGRTFATLDAEGDGTLTGYEPGTYAPATGTFTVVEPASFATATHLRAISLELRNSGLPVDGEKVMHITIEDRAGRVVREELHLHNGTAWSLATASTAIYNDTPVDALQTVSHFKDGRPTGTQTRISPFSAIETDEQGITTGSFTDSLGRVTSVVVEGYGLQPSRTTSTAYVGRSSTTTLSAGALSLTTAENRDLLGRIVSSTDATGAVTSTSYPNGGRVTEVTRPGNNSLISTRSIDGLTLSVTGTAAVNEFWSYQIVEGKLQTAHRTGTSSSGRLASTVTDGFGRQVSSSSPSPAADGEFVTLTTGYAPGTRRAVSLTSSAANTVPRLMVRPDLASSLQLTGINASGGSTLTIASQDRITATRLYFTKDSGEIGLWWSVSESKTYDDGTDSGSAITKTVRERLSGNADGLAAKSVEILPGGAAVTTTVEIALNDRTRTTSVRRTDCDLPETIVNLNGLDVSQTTNQSVTPTVWGFDALGRILTETTPLGAVTKTLWNAVGQISSVTDPLNHTTTYEWWASNTESAGRLKTVKSPVVTNTTPPGQTTQSWSTRTWSTRGELLTTVGNAEYPVTYTYNPHGDLETQTTWRGTGATAVAETTTWQYAANSGVLFKRINSDASETSHTWYASGKPHTRTRESGAITTWTWNALGDLTAIGYTGDSNLTPDVTITAHTRLGQPSTINQSGIGSETITFRPSLGVPLTHSYASNHTLLPGKQIAYNVPDAYGQPTGFTPSDGPAVTFVWDQGLLHAVSTTHGTHSYEYRQDTALVKNVTANNGSADTFRQTYSRDIANRLLAASSSVPGTSSVPLTRHGYRLDELNRRTNTTLLDGSTWTWGYNDRSEVTAASRKQLGGTEVAALGATYSYDEIGNRMTSTSPILGDFGYTTNSVNQYATITSNNSRTVLGKAPATSTITVNGLATTRIDTLFHKGISADNSNDPLWLQADISDGTTTQTRYFWLPKASTSLTYVGGNLTNDGQWSYLWDAENRLVEMEATIAAVNAGRPCRKLAFAYDWTGRRLARTITATNNSVISATRWLYDGWNPVAEYSLQTSSLILQTSYLWGLDISGTLTDAGGVGGLLAVIASNPTTVYHPSFDGNGNITAWTQSGATAPVCRREYDAFGNIVVEQGTAPCAFGFSTKLEDPETHLLYYGYRYYSPPLGRWPSRDPIEEKGGVNLYGFVGNDGVGSVDRLGRALFIVTTFEPNDRRLSQYSVSGGIAKIDKFLKDFDPLDEGWYNEAMNDDRVYFNGQKFKGTKAKYREKVLHEKASTSENIVPPDRAFTKVSENAKSMSEPFDINVFAAHGQYKWTDMAKGEWEPTGKILFGMAMMTTSDVAMKIKSITGKVEWVSCFKEDRKEEVGIVIPADGGIEYLFNGDDPKSDVKVGCKGIWFKPFDFSHTKQPFTPPRPVTFPRPWP